MHKDASLTIRERPMLTSDIGHQENWRVMSESEIGIKRHLFCDSYETLLWQYLQSTDYCGTQVANVGDLFSILTL